MAEQTTDVATQKPQEPAVFRQIMGENFKKQISTALAKHMTPDRFVRVSMTAMRRNPKLQQCTIESVLGCLMDLAQMGLEADGRRAYLVPFDKKDKRGVVQYTECTKIVSYMGLAELAMRSGMVSTIHADVVCEGDIFIYSMGELTSHVPWFLRRDKDKPAAEGDMYAVYALVKNRDGTTKCEVMSIAEVNKVRDGSQGKNGDPWTKHWSEMAKKTVFKRLSKWLVLSPEFRDVASAEDDDENVIVTSATRVNGDASLTNLVGSGALLGDGEIPEETDRRTLPKISKEDAAKELSGEDSSPVSYMCECINVLKEAGVPCIGEDPEGTSLEYELADSKHLILCSKTPAKMHDSKIYVDVFHPEAVSMVKSNIEVAVQRSNR